MILLIEVSFRVFGHGVSRFLLSGRLSHVPSPLVRQEELQMIRKMIALIPVCAMAVACGGEATPEPAVPEGAAATEEAPAEGEAAPAEEATEAPAEATEAPAADAPAEGAAPAEGEAAPQ